MVPYERCMRAVLTYIGAPARSRAGASPYLLTLSAQKLRCKLSCAALDELPRDLVLPPFEEVLDGEWVVRGAVVLIALQLALRAVLAFGGYFYWDDLILLRSFFCVSYSRIPMVLSFGGGRGDPSTLWEGWGRIDETT